MNRVLNPSLNPAGLSSAVLALYALGEGIWNVTHHAGAIDPQVIVAAVAAVAALFTRQVVTPVKDPQDGAFRKLVPAPARFEWPLSEPEPVPLSSPPPAVPPAPVRPPSSDPRERSAQ